MVTPWEPGRDGEERANISGDEGEFNRGAPGQFVPGQFVPGPFVVVGFFSSDCNKFSKAIRSSFIPSRVVPS